MQQVKSLPEPGGMNKDMFIDGTIRNVDVFPMREGDKEVFFAYIKKPNTDLGITASIRRIG